MERLVLSLSCACAALQTYLCSVLTVGKAAQRLQVSVDANGDRLVVWVALNSANDQVNVWSLQWNEINRYQIARSTQSLREAVL